MQVPPALLNQVLPSCKKRYGMPWSAPTMITSTGQGAAGGVLKALGMTQVEKNRFWEAAVSSSSNLSPKDQPSTKKLLLTVVLKRSDAPPCSITLPVRFSVFPIERSILLPAPNRPPMALRMPRTPEATWSRPDFVPPLG